MIINTHQKIQECKGYHDQLEKTANFYSYLYLVSILASIIIGILLLGDWISGKDLNFFMSALALVFTVIPLVFKNDIEKVNGYRELSLEFKNLSQDFEDDVHYEKNSDTLKELRKRVASYPVFILYKK